LKLVVQGDLKNFDFRSPALGQRCIGESLIR